MMAMISKLAGWKGYAAAAGIGLVLALAGWAALKMYGKAQYGEGYAAAQTEYQLLAAQATQAAREEEHRRIQEVENVRVQAQSEIDTARAAAARADDTAGRLRVELARIRSAASAAAASHGGQGQPGADPVSVLADLLGRLERDGRAIAGYADQLRVAGLACERSYDALR